ncbi:unnamed protein product, partial [Prorocentrum cordatum]
GLWPMQALSPYLAQAAGCAFGCWSAGGQRCICACNCDVSGGIDCDIVAVLQRQLDCSGPDQLAAPAPAPCVCSSAPAWTSALAGFTFGVVFGIIGCLACYCAVMSTRLLYARVRADGWSRVVLTPTLDQQHEEDFYHAVEIQACGPQGGAPVKLCGKNLFKLGHRSNSQYAVFLESGALAPRLELLDVRLLGKTLDSDFRRVTFAKRALMLTEAIDANWHQAPATTLWVLRTHVETAVARGGINVAALEAFETVWRRFQLWVEFYAEALRIAEAGGHGGDLDERGLFLGNHRSKGLAIAIPRLEQCVAP